RRGSSRGSVRPSGGAIVSSLRFSYEENILRLEEGRREAGKFFPLPGCRPPRARSASTPEILAKIDLAHRFVAQGLSWRGFPALTRFALGAGGSRAVEKIYRLRAGPLRGVEYSPHN